MAEISPLCGKDNIVENRDNAVTAPKLRQSAFAHAECLAEHPLSTVLQKISHLAAGTINISQASLCGIVESKYLVANYMRVK
jgi:hypothetical protein